MKNWEFCEEQLRKYNLAFAMNNDNHNQISSCESIRCDRCAFSASNQSEPVICDVTKIKWLYQEHEDLVILNDVEPEVDWSKVPIDTPVLVSDDKKIWVRRHFATPALKNDDPFTVRTFVDGKTEWSSTAMREEELESCECWRYAKLAEVDNG